MSQTKQIRRLEILPAHAAMIGTQKCYLGWQIMDHIGVKLGNAIKLNVSEDIQCICRVWPRADASSKHIQFDVTVSTMPGICHTIPKEFTESSVMETVDVVTLQNLDVTIIKNDAASSVNFTKSVMKDLLKHMVLANGFIVSCDRLQMGKLFGISYIVLNKLLPECRAGILASNTVVNVTKTISRERYEQKWTRMPVQLGGIDSTIRSLLDLIQMTQVIAVNRSRFKVSLPGGVLLRGPSGCGKTTLVKYVARVSDSFLLCINGHEVFRSRPGETENSLRQAFNKVRQISKEGLCILFFDDVESLCPNREKSGQQERRVVSQLLALLDGLSDSKNILVIGATNKPSLLDSALRSAGRFDKEIFIGIPNLDQRLAILRLLTKELHLADDFTLIELAESTPGFVGADLKLLVQQAVYLTLISASNKHKNIPIQVSRKHIMASLHEVVPSTQRGSAVLVDTKPVEWEDIGGLAEVKLKILQALEWPIKHSDSFQRLGLPRPRGILLYGPPGCAKTTLVRAAATACHVTFLAMSGAQVYSPFVGDSERQIAEVFQQARAGAPSILFIDEIDSVVGQRSTSGKSQGVQDRVLSTLLNEMDGIGLRLGELQKTATDKRLLEGDFSSVQKQPSTSVSKCENEDVLVVAATNRPGMLDEALLRPGRLDKIIYVPPPDRQSRIDIIKVHTAKMHLHNVDLLDIAEKTEHFSGADLENVCREAALRALSLGGMGTAEVSQQCFVDVLLTMKPSVNTDQLKQYQQFLQLFKSVT